MTGLDRSVWLVFLVGAALLALINVRRASRYRQWWGPLLAVALAFVTVIVSREVTSWRPWEALLAPWAGAPWIADLEERLAPVSTWLFGVGALINRFLNLGVLYLAIALKLVALVATRAVPERAAATFSIAYREAEEGRELRPGWVFARWFFPTMAVLALALALLHAAGAVGPIGGQVWIAWPALAFIVFHEIARYLGGPFPTPRALAPTKSDARSDDHVPASQKIGALLEEYAVLWKEWLLARGRYAWDPGERVPSAHDRACEDLGFGHLDPEECRIFRNLVDGRDTLIVDSLPYRVEAVLRAYVGDSIAKGWRVLVLVDEEHQVESAVRWLEGVLDGTVIRDERGALLEAPEVLVLTLRQELSAAVTYHWQDKRTILLVLDAQATALWHGAEVAALRQTLARLSGRAPQLVAMADWRVDLEAAVRNVTRASVDDIRASPEVSLTHYMAWRSEAPVGVATTALRFQDRLFSEINEQLTPETSLVYPALRNEVVPVQVVEQRRLPWKTARSNASDALEYLDARYRSVGHIDDGRRVRIAAADWDVKSANGIGSVVIARDTAWNLPWATRKWMSLSAEGTLVHVVAPAYLYRDYFAVDLGRCVEERRRFSALAPLNLSARWSRAYELYRGLEGGPLDLPAVVSDLDAVDLGKPAEAPGVGHAPEVHDRVRELFAEQLFDHPEDADELHFEYDLHHEFDPMKSEFVLRERLRLGHGAVTIRPAWLRVVRLEARDQGALGQPRVLTTVYRGQLHQRFLPGQTHAFGGEVYELTRFDVDGGVVHCEARPTQAFLDHYRQRRHYRVGPMREAQATVVRSDEVHHDRVRVVLTRYDVEVDVRTTGYLKLDAAMGLDLDRAGVKGTFDAARAADEADDLAPVRRYRHGKLLRARFELPDELAEVDLERVAFTVSLLLNEAFFSHYPEVVPFLVATTCRRPEVDARAPLLVRRLLALVPTLEVTDEDPASTPSPAFDIHFIEDSYFDLGARSSLEKHFDAILGSLAGYLAWCEETGGDQGHFLHFGGASVPAELDLAGTRRVLEGILGGPANPYGTGAPAREEPPTPDVESGGWVDGEGEACDFCGRRLPASDLSRLEDKRTRCSTCDAEAVDRVRAVRRLYGDAKRYFERHYGLTVPGRIHVRVTDANEIAEAHGRSFTPTSSLDARAIGLAVREKDGRVGVYIENGQPRHSVQAVIVHELTHIWQFANLPEAVLQDIDFIEGHAVWVEVAYLRHLRYLHADAYHESSLRRPDEYGRGYQRVLDEMKERGVETPFDLVFRRQG